MARSNRNLILTNVSGKIGDYVVRQVRGKAVISRRPISVGKRSSKQLEAMNRFKRASAYATQALVDPELKELYTKGIKRNLYTPRLVAISDFMNPPVIHDIDLSKYKGVQDDSIIIKAEDDFMVTLVQVSILSGGVVLETGEAVRDPHAKLFWDYKATMNAVGEDVTIQVSAFDTAGNETQRQKSIVL